MTKKRASKKKGPKPDRLQIEGGWVDAVGKAIRKERPKEGWPDEGKDKRKSKQ